jgi:hypothetical protein
VSLCEGKEETGEVDYESDDERKYEKEEGDAFWG